MVVEEEGGTVQTDRRLTRPRTALDGHQPVQWGADDLVLLGLDGGDDVEHLAGAGPFQLGQQGVAATEAGARSVSVSPRLTRRRRRGRRPRRPRDLGRP